MTKNSFYFNFLKSIILTNKLKGKNYTDIDIINIKFLDKDEKELLKKLI